MPVRLLDNVVGYAWAEDKEHCEEYGRMLNADPSKVLQIELPPSLRSDFGNHR